MRILEIINRWKFSKYFHLFLQSYTHTHAKRNRCTFRMGSRNARTSYPKMVQVSGDGSAGCPCQSRGSLGAGATRELTTQHVSCRNFTTASSANGSSHNADGIIAETDEPLCIRRRGQTTRTRTGS